MSHPIVFFEIAGKDGKRLQALYASVFGWAIDTQRCRGTAIFIPASPAASHSRYSKTRKGTSWA